MKTLQEHIPDVLELFDFTKTEKVMKFLEWRWANNYRTPTIDELKVYATKLLNQVVAGYEQLENKEFGYFISGGGFVAEVITFKSGPPRLVLTFYVDRVG